MTTTAKSTEDASTVSSGAFEVPYRALADALRTTALGAARPPIPAMAHALVEAQGEGKVTVTTYSGDTAVTVGVPGQAVHPGRMLVEHATLTKVLGAAVKGARKAALDAAVVHMGVTEGVPTLRVQGYAVPLATEVSVDAFPDVPATTDQPTHVVDRESFVALCSRVLVCADRGDTLPILSATRMVLTEGSVEFTATDRYRLAQGSVAAEGTADGEVVIPVLELDKLLPRLDGDTVGLVVDDLAGAGTWITITSGSVTARIRALDGQYPRVTSILASTGKATISLDRVELQEAAVRAAAITTAAAGKQTPVLVEVSPGAVSIAPGTAGEAPAGAPRLRADTSGFDEGHVVGANPAYLVDAIKATAGERITVTINTDGRHPMVFTDATDVCNYRHVLMPVAVR